MPQFIKHMNSKKSHQPKEIAETNYHLNIYTWQAKFEVWQRIQLIGNYIPFYETWNMSFVVHSIFSCNCSKQPYLSFAIRYLNIAITGSRKSLISWDASDSPLGVIRIIHLFCAFYLFLAYKYSQIILCSLFLQNYWHRFHSKFSIQTQILIKVMCPLDFVKGSYLILNSAVGQQHIGWGQCGFWFPEWCRHKDGMELPTSSLCWVWLSCQRRILSATSSTSIWSICCYGFQCHSPLHYKIKMFKRSHNNWNV